MNKNNISATQGGSVIAPISQSLDMNDIIDLTEMDDDCEITSSNVMVSNNSSSQLLESESLRSRRRNKTRSYENNISKGESGTADDSICILYENLQPIPDIAVVNEIVANSVQNQPANNNTNPIPLSPHIMGTYTVDPHINLYHETVPISPGIIYERKISVYPQRLRDPQPSTRSSCRYATRNENSCHPVIEPHTVVNENSKPTAKVPLNMIVSSNQSSVIENPDIVVKPPKIQCAICLDGPDEIAASQRNFTSTNCGHVFCNICIKTSMKNVSKCPTCRKKITSRSIHPLYL